MLRQAAVTEAFRCAKVIGMPLPTGCVNGPRGVGVLGRDRLGVDRSGAVACHVDSARGASGRVTAASDDALGGGVVGALGVGEACRVETVVDQVLPILADLVGLVGIVGVGLDVNVVDGVPTDLVARFVHRGQFGPGQVLRVHAIQATDVVEGAVDVMWLEGAQDAEGVLVLYAVVEGQ